MTVESASGPGASMPQENPGLDPEANSSTQHEHQSGGLSASTELDSLSESQLVERAREDPDAFGLIYERFVDRIYAYVQKRVGSDQDAEDLTARTFYRALSRLHTYEDRGLPFGAWLFRIAHNLVANWHRDNSRRQFVPLDKLRLSGRRRREPDAVVEENEEQSELWSAIQRLPEDRRNLLFYKFSSHLSNMEIGNIMGRSEGAIKSLYFRTLAALREDLLARQWGRTEETDDENI